MFDFGASPQTGLAAKSLCQVSFLVTNCAKRSASLDSEAVIKLYSPKLNKENSVARYQPTYQMHAAVTHSPQRQPRDYASFDLSPASGALGAEITGLDIKSLDDAAFAEFETALADHLVLFVRDQVLQPDDLTSFGSRFGELQSYPTSEPMPGHPEITEFRSEPDSQFNFGGAWHSDSMFMERPPKYTILYNIECPAVGGDTSFSNLYLAWDTLSEEMRAKLDGVKAINSSALSFLGLQQSSDRSKVSANYKDGSDKAWNTESVHPIARTHPVTGRKSLYVSDCYTVSFVGQSQEESLPTLRQLYRHSIIPDFTCRFKWRKGTLAIWDNRCCAHYAHNDYAGQVRAMWRTIVEGERPS